jgi:nucleotide-binding universal stress UspA family protein
MSDSKNTPTFSRILVPLSGTEADEDAIKMACWIAKRDKSKLYAVYVITIKRSLPLEANVESETRKAEELLEKMERVVEEEDYVLETDLLQAREIAPTIVDEAYERKIDLIFMGVKYRKRFAQFSFGSIIPYILKNAPCRVMLYSKDYQR